MRIIDQAYNLWDTFQKEIKHTNRFFPNNEFLEKLEKTIRLHESTLSKSQELFRARINRYDHEGKPYNCVEMFPDKDYCLYSGRANPPGIPYVYTSLSEKTCLLEIRPIKHQIVTIGKFELLEKIKIVDFNSSPAVSVDEFINSISVFVSTSFSQPIPNVKPDIDYAPLQFISEFIKKRNYDGILFKSSLSEGFSRNKANLVIFNSEKIKCLSTKRVLISKIITEIEFDNCDKFR